MILNNYCKVTMTLL